MRVTIELYEAQGGICWPKVVIGKRPTHREKHIGIARHEKWAPFACNAPLKLHIEDSRTRPGEQIVSERCQCGKVVHVWRVLDEAVLLNDDTDDDCA